MTGVETLFIDRGGIIWDRGGNFSKFINRESHWGASCWSTWTGCFYGSVFSEFLHIARCTLKLEHFLYSRMLSQGTNQNCINNQSWKGFQRYPYVLRKYGKNYNELLWELKKLFIFKKKKKKTRSNQHFLFIRFVMKNVLITNNQIKNKKLYIITFVHNR